ncbi:hypothetical protein NQ315_004625 [Exocentrus adspersus]|uniref:Protein LLP homolog n=1 Tax=Exocentrus adspersus TaxID=1586481 RepID=A0AAV8VN98_9CUCU|nr:hypothetical protein NQ315_004625 [Exocentrus adspersus]
MAKSIRSKWKRKCRAIKRERYGKKELERLKKTLGIDIDSGSKDINMQEISNIATVTAAKDISKKTSTETDDIIGDMEMEEIKSRFNAKTLRDEHGAYPVWLHPRKIKKVSKKAKKAKTKVKAKGRVNKRN